MADPCAEYLNRDKFIFVNKSNSTNVKLSQNILCESDFLKINNVRVLNPVADKAPAYMRDNPLSAAQTKALAEYCKEKNVALFEFLFNQIGFEAYNPNDYKITTQNIPGQGKVVVRKRIASALYKDGKWFALDEKTYLATGAQEYQHSHGHVSGYASQPEYIHCQAIDATRLGAGDQKIKLVDSNHSADNFRGMLMFFQKG